MGRLTERDKVVYYEVKKLRIPCMRVHLIFWGSLKSPFLFYYNLICIFAVLNFKIYEYEENFTFVFYVNANICSKCAD
jgi:hypothetical protein